MTASFAFDASHPTRSVGHECAHRPGSRTRARSAGRVRAIHREESRAAPVSVTCGASVLASSTTLRFEPGPPASSVQRPRQFNSSTRRLWDGGQGPSRCSAADGRRHSPAPVGARRGRDEWCDDRNSDAHCRSTHRITLSRTCSAGSSEYHQRQSSRCLDVRSCSRFGIGPSCTSSSARPARRGLAAVPEERRGSSKGSCVLSIASAGKALRKLEAMQSPARRRPHRELRVSSNARPACRPRPQGDGRQSD